VSGFNKNCELCSPSGEDLIWSDDFCRVIRVDEKNHPVFLRVITQAHLAEFSDLSSDDRNRLMHVVYVVEQGLRQLLNPTKINLASFGNVVPHLHWHVIPRFDHDPHYPNPIWGQITGGLPVNEPREFRDAFRSFLKSQLDQF
jgi:diadenosine tetraphosphate (Ap4A) HIT family hydrolase